MIEKIVKKYKTEGLFGLQKAILRRLFVRRTFITTPVRIALDEIIKGNDFTVVQIGAYVGNTGNDPLFATLSKRLKKRKGRLICVEPVKEYFEKLVGNYGGTPNVFFENVAISDRSGPAAFYRLGVDPLAHGFPDWLSQLGSLREDRIRSLWDKYEADKEFQEFFLRHRIEEMVHCMTFAELLRKHSLTTVDLLQMDVEGCELEILRTIDFAQIPIRFVNYESVLLHERKRQAECLMRDSGYRLLYCDQDTFCYRDNDMRLLEH